MKHLLERDKKKRKLIAKFELKRLTLKSIVCNSKFPINIRWKAGLDLSGLPRNSSKTRLNNRCIITGRGKAVHRSFRISRIELRNLSGKGLISGLKKSSW